MAVQDFQSESLSPARSGLSGGGDGNGVLRAAGVVSAATLLSRILGLVREQVLATLFGAGDASDAFNVAFRIPNLLRSLFAEGAMSASLIPTFTRTRIEEGDARAWQLANRVFGVLVCVVGVMAVLGIVFARPLAEAYASAFHAVPGKFELTVQMTRIMFPYFPLVVLAAAFMAVLNACGKFFVPALSSALFNISSVVLGVLFAELLLHGYGTSLGLQPIEGIAIAVVFGGVVQAFCQLPLLYRQGFRLTLRQPQSGITGAKTGVLQDPALRRMLALMLPGIAGLAATQLSVLINTILATSQEPGAVSWLNYAFRLMQFPIGVFGVSLATATLPVLSRMWVQQDLEGLSTSLEKALRQSFAINLPASAGLAFLSYPIIELIFQHGRFQASDTLATAWALGMYSIGLTAYSVVKVLVPTCYAMGNARVPVIFSAITVAFSLALNLILVRFMGFSGLALGTSGGALLNATLLLWAIQAWIRKAGGRLDMALILRGLAENLALALAMGVIVHFSWRELEGILPGSSAFLRLFRVSLLITEGGLFVLLMAHLFGLSETVAAIDLFRKKLAKRVKVSSA